MSAATKTKPSTFRSKGAHFQIVMRPPLTRYENGMLITDDAGKILDFGTPFRSTDGPRGQYTTSDPDEIEFLRNAASFGVEFWELGNEPDALHPTMAELAPQVAAATAELDVDALRALLEAEEASHKRPDVVTMIESAIEALESRPST